MCVVVSQQNADENPPEEIVDIHFALVRLMRANEFGHLSIRTFIFGFGWSREELIELFKVDFLAAPRAIESPNEQAVPMDLLDRGNFNLDDLVCGCRCRLRVNDRDGARAIQPERQQTRETVVAP